MGVTVVTKGFIEVWRGDQRVSQHTVETKAIESALAPAYSAGVVVFGSPCAAVPRALGPPSRPGGPFSAFTPTPPGHTTRQPLAPRPAPGSA